MKTKTKTLTSTSAIKILEGADQSRLVTALAARGTTDLAGVEPDVRRIVNDVRRNGDRALRRHATRLDGLGKSEPLRVPEE
jgi:histidinol dehydrogenase